jgi:DNA polymerase III alpha subunit (gram-positive type)
MSQYYIPFDCETGDLETETGDILTIYMSVMDEEFKVVDELNLKLKPDDRLPMAQQGALRVNGINIKDHLANPETMTYSEGKKLIVAMLKKYHKKTGRYNNLRPLGQNVDFDIKFVQHYLLPEKEWNTLFHYAKIDTKGIVDFLKDAGWFPKDLGSLGSVVDYLDIPRRAAHNAKEDTLMTIDVYVKLLDIMKAKKENGASQDLISLLEAE